MYTNRFISLLIAISLLAFVVLVVREANATTSLVSAPRSYSAWVKAEGEASTVDSATRSYIAQGMAILAERNKIGSATQSYIAQGKAILAERNAVDSAAQSYIAWAKALEAAGKLGELGTCSNMTQETNFAGIDNSLDSATRSYIAWGLALQAKNDIGALCR